MAQVKFGAIVTDIRGKVGGHVFQGNGLTTTMRTGYAGPGQFPSRNQQFQTMNFKIDEMWRDLSKADKDAWNVLARQLPRQDNFGDQNFLTGQNLHRRNYTAFFGSGQTGTIDPTIAIPDIVTRLVFYFMISLTLDRIIITYQDFNVPVASMLYALPVPNRRQAIDPKRLPYINSWLGNSQNEEQSYKNLVARFPGFQLGQDVQFGLKFVNQYGFSQFKQIQYNIPI